MSKNSHTISRENSKTTLSNRKSSKSSAQSDSQFKSAHNSSKPSYLNVSHLDTKTQKKFSQIEFLFKFLKFFINRYYPICDKGLT